MSARIDWSGFTADPRVKSAASVRASDADRHAALNVLAEAYADGRLDRVEYDRRSSTALSAVLLGELRPLMDDLEAPLPALAPATSPRERALEQYRHERASARNTFLTVSAGTVGIWAFTSLAAGQMLFFWPAFPIVAVALGWVGSLTSRQQRTEKLERRYALRDERRRQKAIRRGFKR